ncbi:MAG: IS3 family transposase [Actinomycetota bacterium]
MSRCWFVDDHRHLFEVQRLCELVELPRSTFYAWDNPTLSDTYLADAWLANEIFDIHTASRGTYGAPRIRGQLRRHGHHVGRKRVARIMRQLGLVGAHGRKKWRRGKPNTAPAGDLLERDFSAARPDERWVADISEFACCDGKLFLAGIKDLHDRTVVGWSMGERQTTDLVVNALVMALARRQPDGEVIHHADRGPQFTSLEFSNRMTDWKLQASYGSTGDCFDNAAIESFWGALKRELRHIHGDLERFSRSEMRTILFDHIEVFYNRQRHQAGLAHRTPAEVYAAAVA